MTCLVYVWVVWEENFRFLNTARFMKVLGWEYNAGQTSKGQLREELMFKQGSDHV